MNQTEAHRIASHHLGDTLTVVTRGGPTGDDWIIVACDDIGGHVVRSARAATVDAAAADCAAKLRAAGWSPSHARLEWADNRLYLCIGRTRFVVATYLLPGADLLFHPGQSGWIRGLDAAGIAAECAEWCAANLPSLHLPLFPGDSR